MEKDEKRRIAVLVGSDSDFPQCSEGLYYLRRQQIVGQFVVIGVNTMSIHRNMCEVLEYLDQRNARSDVDVIIAGAGWAAHLPGMMDAYLGYVLNNTCISIIGVAFEDSDDVRHTLAAQLSISEVPGTRVIQHDNTDAFFVGADGFSRACRYAVSEELPVLKEMKPRPIQCRTLEDAITFASQT